MEKRLDTGLDNKQIMLNMLFSVISFVLNIGINFFITPYITMQLGSEAYGYVKLANDFANYATLATLALNSMSSRFIMLNRTAGKEKEALIYYNSVTIANVVLAIALVIPSFICTLLLDKIISIPIVLVYQVRLTFALTFANFVFNLVFSGFSNCYYLTNRLEIQAIQMAKSNIIKSALMILLFVFLKPQISYIIIATICATVYLVVTNIYYTKKLTPDMRLNLKFFNFGNVWELLASGIWNSITKLSQIFSSGLDLLITNIFVNSMSMGYLSVAKTIPNIITSFNSTMANAFSANLLALYAKNDMENLKKAVKSSMKFMCIFVAIPNAILFSMGIEFFRLWVPGQPAEMLNVLSILTVINSCVTGPMQPLYQIFTITNKIKQSSIAMIIYGFSSSVLTLIVLNITSLGVYAVAGVSLLGSLVVALVYHLPYSAKYIGLPWYTFFPEIGKSIFSFIFVCITGYAVNYFIVLDQSWIHWFLGAISTALIGFVINIYLVLNREERYLFFNKIASKFNGKLRR